MAMIGRVAGRVLTRRLTGCPVREMSRVSWTRPFTSSLSSSSLLWREKSFGLVYEEKKIRSFSTEAGSSFEDCTGTVVKCSHEAFVPINSVIDAMVRSAEEPLAALLEAAKVDPNHPLLQSLALLHYAESGRELPSSILNAENLHPLQPERLVRVLESKLASHSLGPREQYYAAAAIAWIDGNPLKAAALFESLIIRFGPDLIALLYAQSAYLAAGRPSHILGSTLRHPIASNSDKNTKASSATSSITTSPSLPLVYALSARGYLESGRLTEAEESATRGATFARASSSLPLSLEYDLALLAGRPSEVVSLFKNNVARFSPYSQRQLRLRAARGHMMRGSVHSAVTTLHDLFVADGHEITARFKKTVVNEFTIAVDGTFPLPILRDGAILLWSAMLRLDNRHIVPLDIITRRMRKALSQIRPCAEKAFVESLLLGIELYALQSRNVDAFVHQRREERDRNAPKTGIARLASIFTSSKVDSNAGIHDNSDKEALDDRLAEDAARETLLAIAEEEFANEQAHEKALEDVSTEIANLFARLEKSSSDPFVDFPVAAAFATGSQLPADAFSSLAPNLAETAITLPFVYHNDQSSMVAVSNVIKSQNNLSRGLLYFALGYYSDACELLSTEFGSSFINSGFGVMQRDIFSHTLAESYLRSGDMGSALMLLSERSVLVPNDCHTWQRLAVVHKTMGNESAAADAQYSAWQMGVGQGGFGGHI